MIDPPEDSDLINRVAGATLETRVTTFLEFATWDHCTYGKSDHRMYDCAAQRIVTYHPELARHNLYTAIVCGDFNEVGRILSERPSSACEAGGPRGWTPILYLSFTRFTHQPTLDNALEIARLLLTHGANPNDYYMAGDARYSVLTGVAGEGEQDSPRQPYASALFQLLLESGAEPFDIQVLYNTHFSGRLLWWLELVHAHTIATDRRAAWDDPDWPMFDMGGYGCGARFLLTTAIATRNVLLAEWLLARGANPNAAPPPAPGLSKRTLYEEALREGETEMAGLLERHGAVPRTPVLNESEQFALACFTLDRVTARTHLDRHPDYLTSPLTMFAAAKRDRADVIAFLLDLGVPLEIEDQQKARALHHAAGSGALSSAALLIDQGAEVDPRDTSFNATPLGWAIHFDQVRMRDVLSSYSRDVRHLAACGYVDRLRDVLSEAPSLSRQVTPEGITLLWWLPDDEAKAIEVVSVLLAAGADPTIRNRGGRTAMDWALKRGMVSVARRLAESTTGRPLT